jgi:hypothetical protein
MSDDYTTLNPGVDGDAMDEEAVTYGGAPTTRKRPRVVIGGSSAEQLAAVGATEPASTDYGLVVRPVVPAQGDDSTTIGGPLVQASVNDTPSILYSGTCAPLSLTNDGRLRVSVVDARSGVPFFDESQCKQWGSLENSFTFSGSPWGD